MKHTVSKWLSTLTLAALLSLSPQAMAQAVVYPQQEQAGKAQSSQADHTYTLSNHLFSASFVHEDGKLTFQGCPALGLLPGTEPFKIQVGSGTDVLASQMTLTGVRLIQLTPESDASRASLKLPGHAIEASYTYQNLKLTWRAVLRDGSHYLRTELSIHATADTQMHAIYPMLYSVDNSGNKRSPAVTGNTRGAIITSDKIFAGVETPTAFNTANNIHNDVDGFTSKSWTADDFHPVPASVVPAQILSNGTYDHPGTPLTADAIVSKHGYLTFYEPGDNTITFQYTDGDHRLNLVGVDVRHLNGQLADSDYHTGFTGGEKSRNSYTVRIPAKGSYEVRYYVETKTETILSSGSISYSHRVSQPEVRFDGQQPQPQALAPATRALSKSTLSEGDELTDSWSPSSWTTPTHVPPRLVEMGFSASQVRLIDQPLTLTAKGDLRTEFVYSSGNNGLNIIGTVLLDADGNVVANDLHKGFSGYEKRNNIYTIHVPYPGTFTFRYYAETKTEPLTSSGQIKVSLVTENIVHLPAQQTTDIEGKWSRKVVLKKDQTWHVSAVVGLMAPGQERRSVACYIERERAVPWRAFPAYISWYELNIDRNNDRYYTTNMNVNQCADVVEQWRKNLYEKHHTGIAAFVWDDGWDQYGTWTFNKNFPHGFREPNDKAVAMHSGIGAWLGPVGGYGKSGDYRREYWQNRGGMQLSNPAYYKVFYDACSGLIHDYDFRFFKFDGISDLFTATGPKDEANGDENAEAIIHAEQDMRLVKPDIFFNTTVGTWASPFWFHITDAVWRQEADYAEIGDNYSDRERWITYRDHLVYQNFVDRSPMCPINCLMTHGFILTKHGDVSKDMNYAGILREMRCAFACGSGMVELYCDYELMNTIANAQGQAGVLWADLAECIQWQKKNASVLPDTHWVGGNPWNGSSHEVYGWASWNGRNAVLTLRNGSNGAQTFETTLREALEIPRHVSGSITFNKAFAQADLSGFPTDEPIDIDRKLTLRLPGSSVYVFDNTRYAEPEPETPAIADGYYRLKNYKAGATSYLPGYPCVTGIAADPTANDVQMADIEPLSSNVSSIWQLTNLSGGTLSIRHANAAQYLSVLADGYVKLGHEALPFSVEDWSDHGTYGFYHTVDGTDQFLVQRMKNNGGSLSGYPRHSEWTTSTSDYAWKLEPVQTIELHLSAIGDSYWTTLCLPFSVSLPLGCEAYIGQIQGENLVLTSTGSPDVPAHTPVVIRATGSRYTLSLTDGDSPLTGTSSLRGCTLAQPLTDGQTCHLLGSGDLGLGFYPASGETLPANSAFLEGLDAPHGLKVVMDGEQTGIHAPEAAAETDAPYYDLLGRRVSKPSHGIYIHAGKKVYVD